MASILQPEVVFYTVVWASRFFCIAHCAGVCNILIKHTMMP